MHLTRSGDCQVAVLLRWAIWQSPLPVKNRGPDRSRKLDAFKKFTGDTLQLETKPIRSRSFRNFPWNNACQPSHKSDRVQKCRFDNSLRTFASLKLDGLKPSSLRANVFFDFMRSAAGRAGADGLQRCPNHAHSARLIASINCRKRPKLRRCGVSTSRGKARISGSFRSCGNALLCTIEPRRKTSANLLFNSATLAAESARAIRITSFPPTHRAE